MGIAMHLLLCSWVGRALKKRLKGLEPSTFCMASRRKSEEDWRETGWDREIADRLAKEYPDMRAPYVRRPVR
jgi:hypothetical protein